MPIPNHYRGASNYGRKYLYQLGFADGWNTDLFTAVERHYPELLRDAYLFSAIKYLWRVGVKGDPIPDVYKALDYLRLWLDTKNERPLRGKPTTADVIECINILEQDYRLRIYNRDTIPNP